MERQATVFEPNKVMIPLSMLRAVVLGGLGAAATIAGIGAGIWLRLGNQESLQREQGVKIDMMLDLWRQSASDIKERPTRHEFDDLRQELRQGRKE